jgi:hypothetical protein
MCVKMATHSYVTEYSNIVRTKFPVPNGYIECPENYRGIVYDRNTMKQAECIYSKHGTVRIKCNNITWQERSIWWIACLQQ